MVTGGAATRILFTTFSAAGSLYSCITSLTQLYFIILNNNEIEYYYLLMEYYLTIEVAHHRTHDMHVYIH